MVAVLVVPLRSIERWLHQHIFKVGWLVTGNMHTTTILYYTFFLPGIILYEIIVWLIAGMLNVRAERTITWPEQQEVAELDLKFVEIPNNTHPLKTAIIYTAPTIVGLLVIALIANRILDVRVFFETIGSGHLTDVSRGIGDLTRTTDFWIWIYLAFTISNTMLPDFKKLSGFRIVGIALVVIAAVMFMIGAGNQTVGRALRGPVTDGLNTLSGIIVIIIGINIFAVAVLAFVEASIERVTGKSAIFRRGKMVAMTREEVIAQREQNRQRQSRRAAGATAQTASGPPSIYKTSLPIPGAPGDEPVTQPTEVIIPDKPAEIAAPRERQERPTTIEAPIRPGDAPSPTPARPDTGRLTPSSLPQLPSRARSEDDDEATGERPRVPSRPDTGRLSPSSLPQPPSRARSDDDDEATGERPRVPSRPDTGRLSPSTRPPLPTRDQPAARLGEDDSQREDTSQRLPSPTRPPAVGQGASSSGRPAPRPQSGQAQPPRRDMDKDERPAPLPRPATPRGIRREAEPQDLSATRGRPVPRPTTSQGRDTSDDDEKAPLPRPATPRGIRRTAEPQNLAASRGSPIPRPRTQDSRPNEDEDDDELIYEDIEDVTYDDIADVDYDDDDDVT